MATRRPLVLVDGRVKELPTADSLPGGGSGGYFEGPTAPDPVTFPLWFNTTDGVFLVYVGATWVEPGANFVPPDGATGQVLAKASANDHDLEWVDPPAGVSPILSWMI